MRICAGLFVTMLAHPAFAGPPYVSDDPQPTDYKHFEIYTFNNGTTARDGTTGQSGIDFNYGAAPDLQLTATLPAGFDRTAGGGTKFGLSNVELAAKYRFLHQDGFGLDVSVFPRVFLPAVRTASATTVRRCCCRSGFRRTGAADGRLLAEADARSQSAVPRTSARPELFCPIRFCPNCRSAPNSFTKRGDTGGTPATSSLGIGWRFDINETYHLLGYVRRGIENAAATDRYSWYASVLFTF